LVKKLGLEVHDHPNLYPLGLVNKDVEVKITKQCTIKFSISVDYIDEMEVDVVIIDMCGVVFGSPYMYMRDGIFMRRENQYRMIKDKKYFIINAHKGKSKIYVVSSNQDTKLIVSSRNFLLLFFKRESTR